MKILGVICSWLALVLTLGNGTILRAAELTKAELKEAEKTWKSHQAAAKKALRENNAEEALQSYRLAIQTAEKFGEDDKRLSDSLEGYAELTFNLMDYNASAKALERDLAGKKLRLGERHSEVYYTMAYLGMVYGFQKKHDEAAALITTSLDAVKKKLGAYHPFVGRLYNSLGNVHLIKGDYAQAEIHYKEALTIAESERMEFKQDVAGTLTRTVYHADYAGVAMVRNNLALAYEKQNKVAETEKLFEDSLKATERAVGKNTLASYTSLQNLGKFYLRHKNYAKAEQMILRSHELLEKAKQSDPFGEVELAGLYALWNDNPEAPAKQAAAIQRLKKSLEAEAAENARDLPGLAGYFAAQENYEVASLLALRHAASQRYLLPVNDAVLFADVIHSLDLLMAAKNYDVHQKFIEDVLSEWDKELEAKDRRLWILRARQAGGLVQERKFKEAAAAYEKTLPQLVQVLEAQSPELALAQWQQGELRRLQGDSAGAYALYQKAYTALAAAGGDHKKRLLEMLQQLVAMGVVLKDERTATYLNTLLPKLEQAHGAESAELVDTLQRAGDFYTQQNKPGDAATYYGRMLAIQTKQRGADNIVLVPTIEKLLPVYAQQGKTTELEGLYKQRLAIYEKAFGPKHPGRIKAARDYAAWLRAQGRNEDAAKLVAE